jgi:hypothetical protein
MHARPCRTAAAAAAAAAAVRHTSKRCGGAAATVHGGRSFYQMPLAQHMCPVPSTFQHRRYHLESQWNRAELFGEAALARAADTTSTSVTHASGAAVLVPAVAEGVAAGEESRPGRCTPTVDIGVRHGHPLSKERRRVWSFDNRVRIPGFQGTLFQPRSSTSRKMMCGGRGVL